jgi:hypothetical protein
MAFALNITVAVRRIKIYRANIHGMIVQHIQYINAGKTATGMPGIGVVDIFQDVLPVFDRFFMKICCTH